MPSKVANRLALMTASLALCLVVAVAFWGVPRRTNDGATEQSVPAESARAASTETIAEESSASSDLPLLEKPFDDVWVAAQRGDPEAQLRVSRLLALCTPYNFVTKTGVSGNLQILWDVIKRDAPGELARMKAISEHEARYCLQVQNGRPISPDEVAKWRRLSAERGSVVAQLEQEALSVSSSMNQTEREALIRRAIAAKDPEALFYVGRLAGNPGASIGDASLSVLMTGSHAALAWQVVACRMGYPCSRSSRLMIDACLYAGLCGYGSFEELAHALVPRADRRVFDDRVLQISNYVANSQ